MQKKKTHRGRKRKEQKKLKTRARIRAPSVVFGNHAGDSPLSAVSGVRHRAHARAGCTKIVTLLGILGGFGPVTAPWGGKPDVLSHTPTCTREKEKKPKDMPRERERKWERQGRL